VVRAVFFGLGADGTVGANKNSIKIIGEDTDLTPRAISSMTPRNPARDDFTSALWAAAHPFAPTCSSRPILSPAINGRFWIVTTCWNTPRGRDAPAQLAFRPREVWNHFSIEDQREIIAKKLKCYVIDAYAVAKAAGMGGRINTIMQTCFFAISNVLPREEAIAQIKRPSQNLRQERPGGVDQNFAAVDQTLAALHEAKIPDAVSADRHQPPIVPAEAPDFVQRVTAVMLANKGDLLPVSAFPVDGTWPSGTTRWEKRAIALEIPEWDSSICIQCNKCVLVCPHAAIRAKFYPAEPTGRRAGTFKSTGFRSQEWKDSKYSLQVAPEDCTGCTLCVAVCPVKSKTDPKRKAINMEPMPAVARAGEGQF
jgi:pyruvate-ferredoxin/flavodoxin oxidoreductase